ncbi:uncharacterized protein [Enoplosus armatus]|uniref:uncharacterized protein n=1 Tax=Enoplosus armatus TaxID=215367 RepID=UPI0039953CBA
MALKVLERRWKTALTSILEELTESQLRKLLISLNKIPQGVKNRKVSEEIPELIIQYFGTEGSISVIDKEMKQLPRMDEAVQSLLRPFVDKLKRQQQKIKGAANKPAADSGSVAKRQGAAAGAANKPAADSGSVAKGQEAAAGATSKPATDSGSVAKGQDAAAGAANKPAADSGSVAKGQEAAAGATSKPATDSGSVAKGQDAAAGATSKPAADSGSVAKGQEAAADQPKNCQPDTKKTTSNLKGSCELGTKAKARQPDNKTAPHPAVLTGDMKLLRIIKVNKKNTHLEAEFNNQLGTFYVTSRLLAKALGFKLEGDLLGEMPLSVQVKIQGNKITELQKM